MAPSEARIATRNELVLETLKLSNMRNDMREINSLAASLLRKDGNHELMIRTILRISRDAIYR